MSNVSSNLRPQNTFEEMSALNKNFGVGASQRTQIFMSDMINKET
jgi:hypothetical protein